MVTYVAIDNVNLAPAGGSSTPATILDRPNALHGRPINVGTKRIGFELWTSTGAVWGPTGSTVWGPTGSAKWGGTKVWRDITDDVTGYGLGQRGSGSTLAERPNPGQFTLTVQNPDDVYSTWHTQVQPYVGPGAVIRCWINDPAEDDDDIGWQPLILGVVETVTDDAVDVDAYRFVTMTLIEAHADLAKIDGYEQPLAGGGEHLFARTARLLAAAGYRFGSTVGSIVAHATGSTPLWGAPLQATNLSANRLTELYLTADSADSQFVSSKKGQPEIISMPDPGGTGRTPFITEGAGHLPALGVGSSTIAGTVPIAVMPWTSLTTAADNDAVVSKVVLARAGGSQRTAATAAPRTGPQVFSRSDLILTSDGNVQTLANRLLARGVKANQYVTAEVDVFYDVRLVDWLAQLDLYQKVDVIRTFVRDNTIIAKDLLCIVIGYSMNITPLAPTSPPDGGPVTWTARVNLQVVSVTDYTP